MKILHIASFNGNIGDNANHNGFRKNFQNLISENIEWNNLEIRNFYKSWNKMKFDENFIKIVNKYDLLIIGGGNFFEICHNYSSTGTTIDISIEILKQIKIPIFFNSLGLDSDKEYTVESKEKFKKFIDYLLNNYDKYFVSFRNDGSKQYFINLYGYFDNRIKIIPDGGFFFELNTNINLSNQKYIGINMAIDSHKLVENLSYDELLNKFKSFILKFILKYPEYKILFFPHILSDLKIIYDIVSTLDDIYIKYNIEIAPYLTGEGSEKEFYKYYLKCKTILGMRFHANVVGIAFNIPTIGLVSYSKIKNLYSELRIKERIINIKNINFSNELLELAEKNLINKIEIEKELLTKNLELKILKEEVYIELKKWINSWRKNEESSNNTFKSGL